MAWQTRTLQSGLTVENTSPGELFTGPKSPFVRSSSNIHMTWSPTQEPSSLPASVIHTATDARPFLPFQTHTTSPSLIAPSENSGGSKNPYQSLSWNSTIWSSDNRFSLVRAEPVAKQLSLIRFAFFFLRFKRHGRFLGGFKVLETSFHPPAGGCHRTPARALSTRVWVYVGSTWVSEQ